EADSGSTDLIVEQHIRSRITVDLESDEGKEPLMPEQTMTSLSTSSTSARKQWRLGPAQLVWSGVIALAIITGFWQFYPPKQNVGNVNQIRSIAVLPFRSLNNDGSNEYLGTGMADALITKLSNIRQIKVRPTSAIMKYGTQLGEAQAVGRELGVDSVLEGTVQRINERVRVTVQLVNVSVRNPLWARNFDENITDIFGLQDTISEQVARAMLVELNSEQQRHLRKRETENIEAYQEYLRGRFFWNQRDEQGLTKSLGHFQRAIVLDPNYGAAHAGMADAYTLLVFYHVQAFPAAETIEKAKASAIRAIAIDESLAEAHASLALIKTKYELDDRGAETEFKRAIELNPNYATAHHWYSDYLGMSGREAEAMREIKIAQELDPLSPVINTTLGERLYFARQYDEAIVQLRKTLEVAPAFGSAHFTLGLALEQKGLFSEAVAELQKANGTTAVSRSAFSSLGHTYAVAGQADKARSILRTLLAAKTKEPYQIAVIYQGLGDKEQVIGWLNKIENKGSILKTLLRQDPRLDSLRSEPRFRDLL